MQFTTGSGGEGQISRVQYDRITRDRAGQASLSYNRMVTVRSFGGTGAP